MLARAARLDNCHFRIALLFLPALVFAQVNSGTVTGVVTDPSGAIVPGASVAILQDETKSIHTTITNSNGEYASPYLEAGTYSITVTAANFPALRVRDVRVATAKTTRVNVELPLSTVQTQLTVSATTTQLETDSSAINGSVDQQLIFGLPNINQNPLMYATLQAGVAGRMELAESQASQSFGIGFDGRRFFSAFNMNGGAAFTNEIQLDGLNVMGSAWNEATVIPNTDSLQEVRVATSNYSAEYGRGQGLVEMITKGGTNQFHGGVYYRNRNEALNANTFLNNADGIARQRFRVNDFGGSVGGPIIHDKLFFFTSYERLLHNDTPEWLLTVPTAAQRTGDFSHTLTPDFNGQPTAVVIYNPFSVTQVGPNLYQRAPYPNAIIPNPSPYALKLMSIYPLANRAPTDLFGDNNFFTTENRTFQRSSSNNRLDFHHGKQSIYASGGISIGEINTPSPYGRGSPFFVPATVSNIYGSAEPEYVSDDNPYIQIGDTVVLSPSTVLDVRYGVARIHSNYLSDTAQNWTASQYASYGIPANVQSAMPAFGATPDVQSPGFFSNPTFGQFNNKHERQTDHRLNGSITQTYGRWILKAGGEFRVDLSNFTDYQNAAALYSGTAPGGFTEEYINASGAATAQDATVSQQGFAGATILTGAGGWSVSQTFSPRPALTDKYIAIFSQNDWHATPRLTVNLGLRWEVQPAPTDRFNRASVLNLAETNAFGTPGTIVFPGNNGLSRNLWNTVWDDFGPRLGLAYRVTDNWVVRGGYGVSYAPNNTGWYDGPYTYAMGAFAPGTQILPYGTNPNGTLVGSFSDAISSPIIPAIGPNSAAPQIYGSGFPFFDRNSERPPRIQQWNFIVERQVSKTWFISVGYSGSHGNNLLQSRFPLQDAQNVPTAVLDSWRQTYISTNALTNPGTVLVPNPLQPATGPLLPFQGTLGQRTIPAIDTYYPYLALLGDSIQNDHAFSSYNSLQIHTRHTFSSGLLVDANYVWSKSIDNAYTELQDRQGFSDTTGSGAGTDGLDILNLNNDKKLSYTDVPHRFIGALVYELPFGRGHALAATNRIANALLQGWRIGSVVTLQSGFPLAPTGANTGSIDNRPNLVPGEPLVLPKSLQGWYNGTTTITLPDGRQYTPCAQCYLKYNPDAFAGSVLSAPNGTTPLDVYWMGNAAIDYGVLRTPGRNNVDLSLSRDIHLKESLLLSFRANATNAFNHTQFLASSYTMDLGSTISTTPVAGGMPGQGSSNSYGSHGLVTYDPRQIILEMRLRF